MALKATQSSVAVRGADTLVGLTNKLSRVLKKFLLLLITGMEASTVCQVMDFEFASASCLVHAGIGLSSLCTVFYLSSCWPVLLDSTGIYFLIYSQPVYWTACILG